MPRGYLKHNKTVSKKERRGGHSRYTEYHHSRGWERDDPWLSKKVFSPRKPTIVRDPDLADWEPNDELVDDDFTVFEESKNVPSGTKPNGSSVEGGCAICLEYSTLVPLMKHCKHDHACKKCLREMFAIHAQTDVGNYPLKCFHPPCNRLVPGSVLEQHGLFPSSRELAKHHRLTVLAKAYAGTKKVYHCPNCDHPSYFGRAAKPHLDRHVDCKSCHTKFVVAGSETRESTTIAAVEAIVKDKAGRNDGWARCPKCRIIISKGDGCEWMNCPCDQFFIWSHALHETEKIKAKTVEKLVEPTVLE